jgi:hypothetical protein
VRSTVALDKNGTKRAQTEGAACLKNYLRYAEAMSEGNVADAGRLLASISRWRNAEDRRHEAATDPLSVQIAGELRRHGYIVDLGVGQSHFRVDLGVRRDGEAAYRLGILVDTLTSYEQFEPLERDMLRPRLLATFGWRVATVLAKDWYEDPRRELARSDASAGLRSIGSSSR